MWAFFSFLLFSSPALSCDMDFGIMIDAGSTGSRVFLYQWPRQQTGERGFIVPETKDEWSMTARPGINDFAEHPSDAGPAIQVLFDFAKNIIVEEGCGSRISHFPVYLKASAGMRLLDFLERDQILTVVRAQAAVSGFFFDVDNIRVISGEEEGVYGWISVNWLKGTLFDTLDGPGAIDLGGSSAQITFTPVDHHDIVAGYFPLRFRGHNIRLYTHSFLQYGHEAAMYRLNAGLLARAKGSHLIPHPCLPKGSIMHGSLVNHTKDLLYDEMPGVSWEGTGDFTECLSLHLGLLDHADCTYSSCSFAGVYQPRLLTRRFTAIGHVGDLIHKVMKMNQDSTLEEIRAAASDVCSSSEHHIRKRYHKAKEARRLCSDLVWTYTLLHHGFGFPLQARQIQFNKLEIGQLGAMMYEANILPWVSARPLVNATDAFLLSPPSPTAWSPLLALLAWSAGLVVATAWCCDRKHRAQYELVDD